MINKQPSAALERGDVGTVGGDTDKLDFRATHAQRDGRQYQ